MAGESARKFKKRIYIYKPIKGEFKNKNKQPAVLK